MRTANAAPRTKPRLLTSGDQCRPSSGTTRPVTSRSTVSFLLDENARLFGLLNLALADSRVAAWDAKYTYGFWRPITAINLGDTDGNVFTRVDTTFTPLFDTPNHPDYPSGHSTTGAAGAEVLRRFFRRPRDLHSRVTNCPG